MNQRYNNQPQGLSTQGKTLLSGCLWLFVILAIIVAVLFMKPMWLPLVTNIGVSQNSATPQVKVIPSQTPKVPVRATSTQFQPAQPTNTLQPAPTTAGSLPTYTVAFDAFPSYYTVILIKQMGLDTKYGFDLNMVTFCSTTDNCYSEEDRSANLKNGTWDAMLTTLDKLPLDPTIGKLTDLVDESDGADMMVIDPQAAADPQNPTLNDLKGQKIAYASGSVGEYFVYYLLNLMRISPTDVQLVPQDDVDGVVNAYQVHQATVSSGWIPNIEAAVAAGGKDLIDSHRLRVIVDVILNSNQSIDQKPQLTQAFYYAWFEALKYEFENSAGAEQKIIDWGHSDWTGVANPGDLTGGLQTLAQAGLGENSIAMGNPDIIAERLKEVATVWQWAGKNVPAMDYSTVIAPQFVLGASGNPGLMSAKPAVNPTFLMTGKSDLPKLTESELAGSSVLAVLPLTKIDFEPNSTRLTEKAQEDILNQLLPVLKASPNLYLRIDGSSAWPAPNGTYTKEQIQAFAYQRAVSVAQFLSKYQIDPDRLVLGFIDSKYPNSIDESQLEQDRYVKFTLIETSGK